jgi:hypothetical protein
MHDGLQWEIMERRRHKGGHGEEALCYVAKNDLARSKPVSGELVSTVLQQMSKEDSRSARCASAGWK